MKGIKFLLVIILLLCLGLGHFIYTTHMEVKTLHEENAVLYSKLDSLQILMTATAKKKPQKSAQTQAQTQSLLESFLGAMFEEAQRERKAEAQAAPKMNVKSSYSLEDRFSYDVTKPDYVGKEEGKVVIDISVNHIGQVVKARLNAESTITDEEVTESCKKAALMTSFNCNLESPTSQSGTITYTLTKNN